MKKITQLVAAILLTGSLYAQAPQKMTYQAVVRNTSDVLITNTTVGMQMSILQSSPAGIAVYIETQAPTTNINGLATIEIGAGTVVAGNFANIDWSAGPYYLKTEIDPNGGAVYSISGTTQLLSVPYALYAESAGDGFSGDYNDLTNAPTNVSAFTNDAGYITTASGNTLDQSYDQGGAGAGRIITVDAGEVEINTATANGIALRTSNTNTGVAIISTSTNAANTFSAIQATTNSNSAIASGIIGSSSGAAYGVSGQAEAASTAQAGIYGNNLRTTGGHGVYGIGFNGVVGETNYQAGFGVYGRNYDAIGNFTQNAVGCYGLGYIGIWGDDNGTGGYSVYSNGDFGAAGTKAFSIDHPLDPAHKYLRHYSIESNEVLNMYRGTVPFDANGEAVVTLPDYFDAVNANFSYQLTPIGGYAPLYIKEKIENGKFVIAGGTNGMEVSWTVYAERNDPYLQQNPGSKAVEVEKESWNQGKYLQPQLYNQSEDLKIVKPLETDHNQTPLKTIK